MKIIFLKISVTHIYSFVIKITLLFWKFQKTLNLTILGAIENLQNRKYAATDSFDYTCKLQVTNYRNR